MDIYASDEEKGEEIKQWWRDNGRTVIVSCILGVAIIFSGRFWIDYKHTQSINASQIYQQVMMLSREGKESDAEASIQILFSDYAGTPYAVFAAFDMAAQSVDDSLKAKTYLEWIIDNAALSAHKEIAKLRLAQILFIEQKFEQSLELAKDEQSSAFSSLWAELKGDIYIAQGRASEARVEYQRALLFLTVGEPRQHLLQLKLDDVAG